MKITSVGAWSAATVAACVLGACGGQEAGTVAQHTSLASKYLLIDTHVDLPYALHEESYDVTVASGKGDFDYPRARRGGLNVAFMSIYVPAKYENNGARAFANERIGELEALAANHPDHFRMVRDVAQARAVLASEVIGFAMGMENGAPLEGELSALDDFHRQGIRYITLAHSESNHIADSSYDEERPWDGLSPFGEQVVARMNDLGIMIDVSHLSDAAFYDVIALSRTPLIASHSSARHFTPGFERNMDDEMIRRLAACGGVIQINFGSSFITAEANAWYDRYSDARDLWLEESGYDKESEEAKAYGLRYREQNPFPYATLDEVLDHFDHVRDLVGVEHLGIGSDFDGVGDSLPQGLKDVAAYPALIAGLKTRNYSEEDIAAILGGNLLRVWEAVENAAAARQVSP